MMYRDVLLNKTLKQNLRHFVDVPAAVQTFATR